MKKIMRSVIGLVLAVSLAIGCLSTIALAASCQDASPIGYVTIDAEKFTLGQGYLKEPVLAPIYEGDSVASVLKRVLGEGNFKETVTAYGAYFAAIRDSGTRPLNIPEYITKAIGVSNSKHTGLLDSGWLGEYDYSADTYSGWMYTQNNTNTNVGAASCTPKNGDVIRFQFSLCCGSDLGPALSWGEPYVNAANKDTLTAQLAKVNSSGNRSGFLGSYAKSYAQAVETAESMEATQAETDSAASTLAKAYDQYTASGGSGKNSHSSGSGTFSGTAAVPSSTGNVSTVPNPAGGVISTVLTQPDTEPVLTGGRASVSVTVPLEVESVIAGASAEKPAAIKIAVPAASMIGQLNSGTVKSVDLVIKLPSAASANTNANAKIMISADSAILQAAKDTKKDLHILIYDSVTEKEIYSWAFSGAALAQSAAPVTAVDLALQVKAGKEDPTAAPVIAESAANGRTTGALLKFGSNGLLPAPAKVRVYIGNQKGCTPNARVYFYHLNREAKILEQMPQGEIVVDANGYVAVTVAHCSDYVLLPAAANAYPVKADTTFPVGLKQGKTYTYAVTVSGKSIPSFTVGNSRDFSTSVKRAGGKYYVTVKTFGAPGILTALYSTLPGQKPVALSYIAAVK